MSGPRVIDRLSCVLILLSAVLLLTPEIVCNRVPDQSDLVLHYTWSAEFGKALAAGE
jgi:hypothetical protein